MTDFKYKKKPQNSFSGVDGFVSNTPKIDIDVRKQFRQNYRPKSQIAEQQNQNELSLVSRQPDGFVSSQDSLEADSLEGNTFIGHRGKQTFDLNLEGKLIQKKRFRFFSKISSKGTKSRKSVFRRIAHGFGAFFLILILGTGSIIGYGFLKSRQIFRGNGDGAAGLQKNVDPSKLNGEGDGRVNILLLGKGGPGHTAPDLTDTILLASIDPVQNEAALLSVPRDFYVQDMDGNSSKINAVYSTAKQRKLAQGSGVASSQQIAEDAGLKAIKDAVGDVLGVPVHYYVMVDFQAFQEAIDTVDGITIDVKEPLYDSSMAWLNGGKALLADEGVQTFDGRRALMYARSRLGSARGDFSNPFKVVELLNTLGENVRTDLNGTGELKRLYEIMQQVTGDKFVSVGLADPPNILVATDFIANQSVVIPSAGLYQYEDIQSYVRNTLRDAFLRKENARVAILNGSDTPGLATAREKELKSYGYNIVFVDTAPTSDYVTSKLIDNSAGSNPYTLSFLEKRTGIKSTTETVEGTPTADVADFVIILGSDEADKTETE
jgi:polyisoprenyl-teichoic acid--peptidoglycan teichoic acid transferase